MSSPKPTGPEIHSAINLLIDNLVNIKDETGRFLLPLPDGRIIDTKSWQGWEWTHGIGLYGVWKYYELTGDERLLKIIEDWFAARFAEGGTTKNINTMAVFLTLAYVYEKTGNVIYLPWLDAWAEWAMHELPRTRYGGMQHMTYITENYQQLWDDTLMMTVMPLAKIGKLLNRPQYIEEAKKQFLTHIKYLFDTKTGLWFHGTLSLTTPTRIWKPLRPLDLPTVFSRPLGNVISVPSTAQLLKRQSLRLSDTWMTKENCRIPALVRGWVTVLTFTKRFR